MAQFSIPSGPDRSVISIDYFKGVDLYNASANVSNHRSPEAPNMIRDEVGKVRKRMGFTTMATFPGQINGVHTLGEQTVVHAGSWLYLEGMPPEDFDPPEGAPEVSGWYAIYGGMADGRSRAIQFSGKLYLLDGQTYTVFDGEAAAPVSDSAYVPLVIIGRAPTGGGTQYEPLNLMGTKWREDFLGTAEATVYQLTTADLDETPVECQVMNSSGEWEDWAEGSKFTVNRTTGTVTFSTAPGASPITGVDNVRIWPSKTREGYAGRINKCDTGALFGVSGATDRIFFCGNPDYPNMDYYSAYNDPTFIGDTYYLVAGQDDSEIVGYSVLGNYLAVHKSGSADGRNILIRTGELDENGNAVFRTHNTLQGPGTVGKYAFASMGNEPLFLTADGVYGITTEELTGEKYSQLRSLYLTNALAEAEDLSVAAAFVWRSFYLLSTGGGRVYLLDGLQKEYSKDAPYSSYQYECYYLTGVNARVFWEQDGTLWFGTEDGRLCRFYNNVDDPASYNDDGTAIRAYWDTPDLSGEYFWHNKTFRYVAVRLAAAIVTGVQIWVQKKGLWSQVYDAGEKARFFDWSYINFAKFVFSADRTPRTLGGKIKVKKVDKARFRFLNEAKDEPFGLYAIGFEFTEPGNRYKG